MFLWTLLVAPSSLAEPTLAFEDDFECSDESSFGYPAGQFGWIANMDTTDRYLLRPPLPEAETTELQVSVTVREKDRPKQAAKAD